MIPNKSLCFAEWVRAQSNILIQAEKQKFHIIGLTHRFMLKETHLSCDEYMHSKEAFLMPLALEKNCF